MTDVDGSGCWSIQGAGVLLSTALSSNEVKFVIVLTGWSAVVVCYGEVVCGDCDIQHVPRNDITNAENGAPVCAPVRTCAHLPESWEITGPAKVLFRHTIVESGACVLAE